MGSMPLHPAIVHLPLAIAILMPLVASGFAWALWTGRVRPRAWLAVVAFQALLLGSGLVATRTGEAEEERVENVIQKSALHRHEALADQFVWAGGFTLVLAGLVLVVRRPAAVRALVSGVAAATLVVAALGLRVGHAGGQLVYVHGAASAYAQPSAAPGGVHREHRE
jgi:uncharacterized membrane protein